MFLRDEHKDGKIFFFLSSSGFGQGNLRIKLMNREDKQDKNNEIKKKSKNFCCSEGLCLVYTKAKINFLTSEKYFGEMTFLVSNILESEDHSLETLNILRLTILKVYFILGDIFLKHWKQAFFVTPLACAKLTKMITKILEY